MAADTLAYGPAPAWVQSAEIPQAPPPATGAVQSLLLDHQYRYTTDGQEFYDDYVERPLNATGLMQVGTVNVGWDPATTQVTINRLQIIRGDRVIDVLAPDNPAGDPFLILRRETNLNLATLDGSLTATRQLAGLQVGDIVRLSLTKRIHDPIMAGHTDDLMALAFAGEAARVRYRLLWPDDLSIRYRTTEGFGQPQLTRTAAGSELVMDAVNISSPVAPTAAPARFTQLGQLELSDFSDWRAVSRQFSDLYQRASTLAPNSPIHGLADTIRAANPTAEGQAAAALKLVQEQIRYVALAMGEGGYVPAAADQTWTRRFGDCKAKTALLLALLRDLGIQADAVAANAEGADGLNSRLPRITAFNHVIVRVTLGDKVYWLDGTSEDGGATLGELPVPPFDWVLPITAEGSGLQHLIPTAATRPLEITTYDIDLTGGLAGLGKPTRLAIQNALYGERGQAMRLAFGSVAPADQDRVMRNLWRELDPDLSIESVSMTDDGPGGALRFLATGTETLEWGTQNGVPSAVRAPRSAVLYPDFKSRTAGLNRDAPFKLPFPFYRRIVVQLRTPGNAAGFSLDGGDSSLTAGGVTIQRHVERQDDVFLIQTDMKVESPETPAAEALAAIDRFKKAPTATPIALQQSRGIQIVVRDISAQMARINQLNQAVKDHPTDAEAWNDRAGMKANLADYSGALKDFGQAIKLNPTNWAYYSNRAYVYVLQKKYREALSDVNLALRYAPDNASVLGQRALIYARQGKKDLAQSDLAAALAIDPKNPSAARAQLAIEGKELVSMSLVDALRVRPATALPPTPLSQTRDGQQIQAERTQAAMNSGQ